MKKGTILLLLISTILNLSTAQRPVMELTFTAIDSAAYVQLDSIKVMNRTQGGDTTLYWPDTVLMLDYQVGIVDFNLDIEYFQVFQNYPNPVFDQTNISLYIPEKDEVSLIVTDILGHTILQTVEVLDQGLHQFMLMPGTGSLFLFTAQWRGKSSSIKMLIAKANDNQIASLKYINNVNFAPQLKVTQDMRNFSFSIGDELLYIAYAFFTGTLESGILDTPQASNDYTFQFATNIPCPETPTVEYEGQVYNTIQIFSQCWLKENLNVGTMIQGTQNMINNGVKEKYCYENDPNNCNTHGGLYQWNEMMQYTMQQGVRGICPPAWHLPSHEEWKVLEGAADSQYGIGDPEWEITWTARGFDVGTNLKASSGWNAGNGTDLFGFSGLPGGFRDFFDGTFDYLGNSAYWWTSSENGNNEAWSRRLFFTYEGVYPLHSYEGWGFSVRCLKDE